MGIGPTFFYFGPLFTYMLLTMGYLALWSAILLIILVIRLVKKNWKHFGKIFILISLVAIIPPMMFYPIYFFVLYPRNCDRERGDDRLRCYEEIAKIQRNPNVCDRLEYKHLKEWCRDDIG